MTQQYQKQAINDIGTNAFVGNVVALGAIGDGVYDNSTIIQQIIDQLAENGGGHLYFPPGVYFCGSEIILKDKVTIDGDSPASSIITFEGANESNFIDACISGAGELSQESGLNSNVDQGDTSITLASSHDFTAGDIGIIWNPTDGSFYPAAPQWREGEFFRVISVSGNTLNLDSPLFSGYTAASVNIYKMSPIKIGIRNVSVKGIGISSVPVTRFELCAESFFHNLIMDGSGSRHLGLARSFDCSISELKVFEHQANIGLNYGVVFGNCQRMTISDCIMSVTRHGITHGGGNDPGSVPCRDTITDSCELFSTESTGWDTHPNGEFLRVSNSVVYGMTVAGDNISINNNRIENGQGAMSGIFMSGLSGVNISIIGNQLLSNRDVTNGIIDWDRAETGGETLTRSGGVMQIIDNEIDMRSFDGNPFLIRKRMSEDDVNIKITGNTIKRDTQDFSTGVCALAGFTTGVNSFWNNVQVDDNIFLNVEMRMTEVGAQICTMRNNIAIAGPNYGLRYLGHANMPWGTETILCEGNYVDRAGEDGVFIEGSDVTKSIIICKNNYSFRNGQDAAGFRSSFNLEVAKKCIFRDNVGGDDQGVPTQTTFWRADTITLLEQENNSSIGINAVTRVSITKEIGHINDDPTRVTAYGTAPPVAGTWSQGDCMINTAPAAGGTPGWVCVTGGTPGTWKAMANLAV